MYPWEWMNSSITRHCLIKYKVEKSVMKTYQIPDWVTFCTITEKFPLKPDERDPDRLFEEQPAKKRQAKRRNEVVDGDFLLQKFAKEKKSAKSGEFRLRANSFAKLVGGEVVRLQKFFETATETYAMFLRSI